MKSYSLDTGNIYEQLTISNIDVFYADYYSGNPYNTTFNIKVVPNNFVGTSQFEYNIKDFIIFVKEINKLYDFKLKKVELNDIGYSSNILFSLDKIDHITISGKIYGDLMEHSLTFIFNTDQTAIATFCKSLYEDFINQNKLKL